MNNLQCLLLCILFFALGFYIAIWYIKREIKQKLSNLNIGPVSLLKEHANYINGIMCYNTEFMSYPDEGVPLQYFNSKYEYSHEIAQFLLILCENVGTMNCNSSQFLLPSSFDTNYSHLTIPDQNPLYGAMFYDNSNDTIVLVWSGTSDLKMAEKDSETIPVPYPPDISNDDRIQVHRGFLSVYYKTKSQVLDYVNQYPNAKNLVICGNSLGGGITYVSAFDLLGNNLINLPTYIYTFGSPRAGNIEFANYFNTSLDLVSKLKTNMRVFNTEDLVPTVPVPAPIIHYEHVGTPVPFTYSDGKVVENHIPCYLSNLP